MVVVVFFMMVIVIAVFTMIIVIAVMIPIGVMISAPASRIFQTLLVALHSGAIITMTGNVPVQPGPGTLQPRPASSRVIPIGARRLGGKEDQSRGEKTGKSNSTQITFPSHMKPPGPPL